MKKQRFMVVAGGIVCVLLIASGVSADLFGNIPDQVVQPIEKGEVNWSSRVVRAVGMGAPNPEMDGAAKRIGAERAAKHDAYRNLLEAIKGIYIDSQTTVDNFMVGNDVIRSRVEGFVQGARVVERHWLSDGAVEVIMEMPLQGEFTDALLPTTGGRPLMQVSGNVVYTGLLVDARGLDVFPAMSPKIIDEEGREVYGSAYVSRDFALEFGIVGYAKDLANARKNDRVSDNPAVVKGVKAIGVKNSDIVIRQEDADALRSAAKNLSFLEKCRVIIVVGEKPSSQKAGGV